VRRQKIGREPTTAHPHCTCRMHDHNLDPCPGTQFIYKAKDGTEYAGNCFVLAGLEWSTRESCPVHGKAAS
jgi:hypothetical protein